MLGCCLIGLTCAVATDVVGQGHRPERVILHWLTLCEVFVIGPGLEGLTQRLNEVKARLQAKLAELSAKQDDAMAAQKEMAKRLEEVGFDVTSTASQVKQVREMEPGIFWEGSFSLGSGGLR